MSKKIKNIFMGATTVVAVAAVGAGAYALVDCANKAHKDTVALEQPQAPVETVHTVSFSAILGNQPDLVTGTMADVTTTGDTPFVLPQCSYTAAQIEELGEIQFAGWSLTGDANEYVYAAGELLPGDFFDDKKDVTFFTIWKMQADQTFDGAPGYVLVGNSYDHLAELPNKAGYIFAGYYDQENGEGTQYYTATGDGTGAYGSTTLYAYWIAEEYEVIFDANGGEGTMENATVTVSSLLPQSDFTRDGWTFAGWSTSPTSAGQWYLNNAEITTQPNYGLSIDAFDKAGKITLYAVWGKAVDLIWSPLGAGDLLYYLENGTLHIVSGHSATVPIASKEGYVFAGYYDQENGQGTQYYDATGTLLKAVAELPARITLYAHFVSE